MRPESTRPSTDSGEPPFAGTDYEQLIFELDLAYATRGPLAGPPVEAGEQA
jgi:hypothetical protein